MTISIDANLFRIVYSAVSTDQTRYYLNGVHIEAHPEKGAILVSTDGHRMIVAHDEEGVCDEPAIVQLPKYALAQCKLPRGLAEKRRMDIDAKYPGSATIKDIVRGYDGDEPKIEPVITVHGVIIDGTFPDWRRVVPSPNGQPTQPAPSAFNARYLKEWGTIGTEVANTFGGNSGMRIALSDGNSPVVIRFAASNIFGVLMPMQSIIAGAHLPHFMDMAERAMEAAE